MFPKNLSITVKKSFESIEMMITEKKFTAEGAGRQILEEAQAVQNNSELIHLIRQTRAELSQLYLALKEGGKGNSK